MAQVIVSYFDSHAHLESPRFAQDLAAVVARARDVGVVGILSCGSDLATSGQALALAEAYQGIYAAVGIHGHQASSALSSCLTADISPGGSPGDTLNDGVFAQLATLAAHPRTVALGELGLDYHYDFSPRPVQRAVLSRQLALAQELGLPVVLHNREADQDMRAVCDDVWGASPSGARRGVLHCFLAGWDMAEWALSRGLYIGVGGPLTFSTRASNPSPIGEVIRRAPLERLLIETDSPYLAPHPHRGRRNEPAFLIHTALRLAELLGLSPEQVAHATTRNARRLFGLEIAS